MKKRIIGGIIIICSILIIILKNMVTNIRIEDNNIEIRFYYADSKLNKRVEVLDSRAILQILSGYKFKEIGGVPTCGFTDDIAIYTNDKQNIFCFACDGCPKIYWKNKNMVQLHQILKKYGMIFPCV